MCVPQPQTKHKMFSLLSSWYTYNIIFSVEKVENCCKKCIYYPILYNLAKCTGCVNQLHN